MEGIPAFVRELRGLVEQPHMNSHTRRDDRSPLSDLPVLQ